MAGGIQDWTFFSTEGQPNGLLAEIGTVAEILDKKLVKALTEDMNLVHWLGSCSTAQPRRGVQVPSFGFNQFTLHYLTCT